MTLDSLCFEEFIAIYDIKTCKICKGVIHWVSFNVHKSLENNSKKLLLLFKPFHEQKNDLKKFIYFGNIHIYLNEKDNIIYIFNTDNKNDDEWDNLQSKLKEYVKIHETNGWENIFQNEIVIETLEEKHVFSTCLYD
jgi:hypothetical protein